MAELSWTGKTKLNAGKKKGRVRRRPVAPLETDARTLAGKPQSCGDTQINRNGLN